MERVNKRSSSFRSTDDVQRVKCLCHIPGILREREAYALSATQLKNSFEYISRMLCAPHVVLF